MSVAAERNIRRQAPILQSTIADMHRRLELPEPSQHHWERKSAILHNNGGEDLEEFLSRGWLAFAASSKDNTDLTIIFMFYRTIAKGLMESALAEPELPYTQEDSTMKVYVINYDFLAVISYRIEYSTHYCCY